MLGEHGVGARESCDRARDTRDASPTSSRQGNALDGAVEQRGCRLGAAEDVTVAQPLPVPATTRALTVADGSPGGAASSSARGRGIATTRSNRSRSARDTFSR